MKTLFKSIPSLSRVLYDSSGVTLGNAIFGNTTDLFDTRLQEEAEDFMVSVPVPGMGKEDIDIHIEGQLLIVSIKEKTKVAKPTSASKRRVLHSFVLPDGIDINRIHAKCRNGLLTVHIEKIKSTKRQIIIKVRDNDNIRNTTPLNSWWQRAKERMDIRKFIPNVRMMKTTGS